jgi:DTW domain-containing protein YfiP
VHLERGGALTVPPAPPSRPAGALARPIRSRRTPRCSGCWLPIALCVCAELPRLAVRTRVVVVMHRREAITSTNTGRLAAAMLEGASVRVRGSRRGEAPGAAPPQPERALTLFPVEGARTIAPADAGDDLVLFVPDGSWTQARRLARRDEAMRGSEIVALPPGDATRYALRRRGRSDGLCTLEAIARALGVLEGPDVESALLGALDRFVERALRARLGTPALAADAPG